MVQITLIGKSLTGKTTLINSICDGQVYDDTLQFFVSFRQKVINDMILEFFDTKEVHETLAINIYCKNSEFVFLTYDIKNKNSLDYIMNLHCKIIKAYGMSKKIVTMGNTFGCPASVCEKHLDYVYSKYDVKNTCFIFDFSNIEIVKKMCIQLYLKTMLKMMGIRIENVMISHLTLVYIPMIAAFYYSCIITI